MTLDSEEQRGILLQALTSVQIQGDYKGLCELFPKMQATVEALKSAEVADGLGVGKAGKVITGLPEQPTPLEVKHDG